MFEYEGFIASFREYPHNRIAVCELKCLRKTVYLHESRYITVTGIARLKPGEPRNKYEAQIVSLGRALKCTGLPKEFRQSFIDAWKKDFLSHHPKEKNRS
jgi:hypothetical protein